MKHILIVDDNKLSLASARSVLSDIYKVTAVTMGAQALRFLEKNTCDLILLDINMPGMDGFEVMKKIRENKERADIPIIFLTADNDVKTESRCLEEGAADFIAKPFIPTVMLSRIGRTLEIEDMRRQLAERLEQKIQEVSDIKSKSQQDVLTGLWNRVYTEKAVNEQIANGAGGAMFMIDMDNFKAINDNYGHIEGDNTLKSFAETMKRFSTPRDILCRIGGDEFVMFINGITDKRELKDRAANIILDLSAKLQAKKYETNTSVSIGIAQIPEDGSDFQTAYNAADKALYYVKQNGKNSFHFFSEQKANEAARGNTIVDLKYLRAFMARADSGKGAYQLNLDSFHHVYNFIRRFVSRSKRDVQTVLFTVYSVNNETGMQEEIENALEILEQAIYISLRRTDVSTKYSGRQVIVILMDADSKNGDMVAKRILDCFHSMYSGSHVKIKYDIAKIDDARANDM